MEGPVAVEPEEQAAPRAAERVEVPPVERPAERQVVVERAPLEQVRQG